MQCQHLNPESHKFIDVRYFMDDRTGDYYVTGRLYRNGEGVDLPQIHLGEEDIEDGKTELLLNLGADEWLRIAN